MSKHVRAQALSGTALPRGIIGAIRADGGNAAEVLTALNQSVSSLKGDFKAQFDGLTKVVSDFRAANDEALKGKADVVLSEKVDRINTAIDEGKDGMKKVQTEMEKISKDIDGLNEKMAQATVGGSAKSSDPRVSNPNLPAYAKAFNTYFRKGESAVGGEHALRELEVKAAMTVGSDPDGGYTVIPEIEKTIDEVVKLVSPMREIASIRQIGTSEYKKLVNLHGTASGWVGETGSRTTSAGPQLSELKFPAMEVYAMPAATQSLLDDSFIDIGSWLASEVQLEFAQKEGIAFVTGDGILKPSGFNGGYPIVANASYVWGKIGYIATGLSADFAATAPADCLVDTYHALNAVYRMNSTWVANRSVLGKIRKLKDGQGNYLLNMVLRPQAFVEEILGRPAVEMPDMPDAAANSYSVALGDFKRGYLIIDRVGIRLLRDPFSSKPYVLFYTTKRVGGGVQNFEAIKLIKFASS